MEFNSGNGGRHSEGSTTIMECMDFLKFLLFLLFIIIIRGGDSFFSSQSYYLTEDHQPLHVWVSF